MDEDESSSSSSSDEDETSKTNNAQKGTHEIYIFYLREAK